MKIGDFKIPQSVPEAVKLLRKLGEQAMPVAGATGLRFMPDSQDRVAVDITRIGLAGIVREKSHYRIGATTTLAALADYHEDGWVLDQVARCTASQQIRNVSTLGGNVARVFPWADFPVALLALEASFIIQGGKKEVVTADAFFDGQPVRLFQDGKLLTALKVPALKKGTGFGYHKDVRTAKGFSLMTAAALVHIQKKQIKKACVAVGAAVPFPRRVRELEAALVGQAVDSLPLAALVAETTRGIAWQGKQGMTEEYGRHLAEVVLQDVIQQAIGNAKGAA